MRRALGWLLGLAAVLALGLLLQGLLETEPRLAREEHPPVDDALALMGPFGVVVEDQARAMHGDLGIDVRVVVRDGGGEEVAMLAERLFRTLEVGRDAPTGGILILIDPAQQIARIEVSYSLEGSFPDVVLSRLARDQLAPYASHRALGMAVMDVLHFLRTRALDAMIAGELELTGRPSPGLSKEIAGRSGGGGAQVLLSELPSHGELERRVPDERRARYAPSADPAESLAAFARAQRDLAGDPSLELFTRASRVMRARYPVAPYEEAVRAQALAAAWPLELRVQGDYAAAVSPRPVREFVPILMTREEGLWRVDLVETFKNLRFDREGHYRLDNSATPYAPLFPDERPRHDASLAPIDLNGEPLETAIERLERSQAAEDRFLLAEILMRNCFVSAEAMSLYAELANQAPPDARYVTVFAERAVNMGMARAAIPAVARLGPSHATRLAWLYELSDEDELAVQHYRRALDWNPRDAHAREALGRLTREAH
jgi:tetratricopeptide (TPR) repeat protein